MTELLLQQLDELKSVYQSIEKEEGESDVKFLARKTSLLKQMAQVNAMLQKVSKNQLISKPDAEEPDESGRLTVRRLVRKMGGDRVLGTVAEQS